jgi:hypothetical protein
MEAVISEHDQDVPQATEENMLHHEAVVEAVRSVSPAIPVRFGTLMHDRAAVASALATRYATLVNDLECLGDKVEMGLTVLWREPAVANAGRQDEASRLQPPGTRYLQRKFSQYQHDALLRDRAEQLARELDSELAPLALETRSSVLPTRRLVMRAAYLVHPSHVKPFEGAFGEIRGKRPDLRFLLTGPWPPYSFVTTTDADRRSRPDGPADCTRGESGTAASR